jgi:tetratricopeptide (TPR) repeat protein
VGVLYGRTASFGFTRTDDKVLIADDASFVRELSSLRAVFDRPFFPASTRGESYYRPVVTSSFIFDAQWAEGGPAAFHVTNTLLHALATCLLFLLLLRLGFEFTPSFLGSVLFAVHPALTEAVAWIPGRCDTLLGIGVLASSLFFLEYLETGSWLSLAGHLGTWALALFSKESGVVLPVLLVAYALWLSERTQRLRQPRLWLGWAGVIVCWALLRARVVGAGAEGVSQRVADLPAHLPALVMHLGKLVVPANLAPLASEPDTPLTPGLAATALVVASVALLRGHPRRLNLWGLGVFLLFLLPSLPVSDFLILENRLYVPAAGLVIATVAAAEAALARAKGRTIPRLAFAGCLLLLLALAARSWSYSNVFSDPEAFTVAACRTSPRLALARLNRGIVLQLDGRRDEAEHEYERALSLDPTGTVTQNNLGLIYLERGDVAKAEALFRAEIAINPTYDKAFFNLGLAQARQGRLDEASASWRQALQLNPQNADARQNLEAATAANRVPGKPVPADDVPTDTLLALYREALRREPGNEVFRRAYLDMCRKLDVVCAP